MNCQPNRWSCLPLAWSYLIGWPFWAVIKYIGHDGSTIQWPNLPEPYCRRGFHPQELIHLGDRLGFITTTFEPQPCLGIDDPLVIKLHDSFEKIVKNSNGVLTGVRLDGERHALAWINQEIVDSNKGSTRVERLEDFQIESYYRIKSKWYPQESNLTADLF